MPAFRKYYYLALLAPLALSGCATNTMNGIMSSWEGEHIDRVIAQWGYPASVMPLGNTKIYRWNTSKEVYIPQASTTTANVYGNSIYANTYTTGGNTISGNCERSLQVAQSGIVKSWQWDGNNCPFAEWMQYSHWRNKSAANPSE